MDFSRLDHVPTIANVMTPFPHSVGIDDPVDRAHRLMEKHGIRHVPVQGSDGIVGVVSHRDLTEAKGRGGAPKVRDACTAEPFMVDVSARLDAVALDMARRHLASAVVTKEGRLAGIFTATDACRVLGELLRERFGPPDGGDAA